MSPKQVRVKPARLCCEIPKGPFNHPVRHSPGRPDCKHPPGNAPSRLRHREWMEPSGEEKSLPPGTSTSPTTPPLCPVLPYAPQQTSHRG